MYEIQPRVSCLYQTYDKIDGHKRHFGCLGGYVSHDRYHHHAFDQFYELGVAVPIYYPDLERSSAFAGDIQIETTLADTEHRSFGVDNLRVTARFQLMDDISGDSVSVIAGITGTQAFRQGLDDPGSFHHGLLEGEAHLSVGQEFAREQYWDWRWWSVLGVGQADVGYSWFRASFYCEKSFCLKHRVTALVNTLWGMGHDNFVLDRHFSGYGKIRHQSVDAGLRYGYWFDCGAELSAEYVRRVYAKNFPENANRYRVSLLYPFGL